MWPGKAFSPSTWEALKVTREEPLKPQLFPKPSYPRLIRFLGDPSIPRGVCAMSAQHINNELST